MGLLPTNRESLWRNYHAASRFFADFANIQLEDDAVQHLEGLTRDYPFLERSQLDHREISLPGLAAVADLLERRRSIRGFDGGAVASAVVDAAVYIGFGRAKLGPGGDMRRLAAPSAGALYPVELYLLPIDIEGFPPRTMHLLAHPRVPEVVWERGVEGATAQEIDHALLRQLPEGSAGVIVLTATVEKPAAKYGERGYRFCLLEAGHVAQAITMTLSALNVDSVCIGGFADVDLSQILRVDPVEEPPIYAIAFGRTS